ncbi:MAG: hypothetical protein PVH88_25295 [Ignavibacteria bacterium]|jgi:hypothetical protein
MVIDLIVTNTGDGYTAEVPSLKGCESWAHNEDEVIGKVLELVRFYTQLDDDKEIKVDRARKSKNRVVYKLVFNK